MHQISPTDYFVVTPADADHRYAENEFDIEEVKKINEIPVLIVWSPTTKSYGLVSVNKDKMFCFCCDKNYCDHTKQIKTSDNDLAKELKQHLDYTTPAGKKRDIICHSFKRLPFNTTDNIIQQFKTGIIGSFEQLNEILIIKPSEKKCRFCGGDLDEGDPVENQWIAANECTIITNTYLGVIYYRPCLGCDSLTLFDGSEECLLNMGSYLVGHDILRSYMHSFLYGRRPLYTFYCSFVDDHKDYGNFDVESKFSYQKFRKAWLSYFDLLDLDYTNGFNCKDCGDDGPDIIICDGTSLSFQRRMWTWIKSPFQKETVQKGRKSSFAERVFIPDARTRNLLHRFAARGDRIRTKFSQVLTPTEKKEMYSLLSEYPTLFNFLHSIDDGSLKLPIHFRNFITSIASPSPVCGYIHPTEDVYALIKCLCDGYPVKDDPIKWQQIHNNIPIIFEILEKSDNSMAPQELRPLLCELMEVSLSPFVFQESDEDEKDYQDEDELAFFPSFPPCRSRGLYAMDLSNTQKSCSKRYKGHPTLLPGVFTLYCQHGICLGFQVMQCNESPNVPYTILKTRFKKAPKIVVYDNACALHAYCINIDPAFFKDTIFLVDRLQWDNHGGYL